MFEIRPVAIIVPPPPPVSWWRLTARAFGLLTRLSGYVLVLGPRYLLDRVRRGRVQAQTRLTRRAVRRIERLGATYVKFGQLVASRADLLPAHVITELAALLDNVTPMTNREFDRQWRAAVGRQPLLAGLSLTGRCLGSGSIACVYQATLPAGADAADSVLAVKLQRPAIARRMATDLALLTAFARVAEKLPKAGGAPLADLIDYMNRAIYGQLDFVREAVHTEQLAKNLASLPGIVVPTVRGELSDGQVLVTDLIPGLSDSGPAALDPEQRTAAAGLALAAVGQMVFQDGFVHCDLHPGNLYIRSDGTVVILDAGYCVDMPDPIREHLAEFFQNLLQGNGARCGEIMFDSALNSESSGDRDVFIGEIAELVAASTGPEHRFEMAEFGQGVFEAQNRHGVHPPSDFAFPLMSLMIAEGTLRSFWPDLQMPGAVAGL
jgi:ubiquinone biosynthesis protein